MSHAKIRLGTTPYVFPMPTVLIGSLIDGNPVFLTVSFIGIVQQSPPLISISLTDNHFTNKGIRENKTFSINIPNTRMLAKTDFVGMNSGSLIEKSALFSVFYGELETAPLIEEAPVNMECRLIDISSPGKYTELFIGEIIRTYSSENYIRKGQPDLKKLDPILFSLHSKGYYRIGRRIGRAWSSGLKIKASPYRRK